jgi:hypothetical protein
MLQQCLLTFASIAVLATSARALFADLPHAAGERLDFSSAVIVTPPGLGRVEEKAIAVLREEIQKRTGLELQRSTRWPEAGPVIALGLQSMSQAFAGPYAAKSAAAKIPGPEGFALSVQHEPRSAVVVSAIDRRGLLYGVGRLLRKMELSQGRIAVPADLQVTTAPKCELRGHQLGYRPKVNAYDAWTEAQFDQYIRELALFGVNSIEIVPPRTDDEPTSPHMKVPPAEMMIRLSEIIDSYGLDVWVWWPNWYPKMRTDYTNDASMQTELADREQLFRRLKRLDHILVPGGDPGNLVPDVLFPWLDKMAVALHRHHPQAKIWVSPQVFEPTHTWLDSFYRHINQKPAWLGGVVFAPWCPTELSEMRRIVDPSIKIRSYPDITHNLDCQFPVRNWDLAFAITLHRECYNPRPLAMKTVQNSLAPYTCGSLTYSEGINDDVNKFVWSDQDWDPATPVVETLRDYGRLFISPAISDDVAQGLLALEKNWTGALATNRQVDVTLQQWQQLDKSSPPAVTGNYRFQMNLLRAYYDAYVKRRLIRETELEAKAMNLLRTQAPEQGALVAMQAAQSCLALAQSEPVAADYRQRCEALADSLFKKIGSQTSVKRYGAQHRTRGAFMDGIDEPLNNVAWLRAQFALARELKDEAARQVAVDQILNRTNPGPGGFYDSLGEPGSEQRIVNSVAWKDDPGTMRSPRITFYYIIDRPQDRDIPLAWKKQACTLFGLPLRLVYDNLDPQASYSVRASYSGRESKLMRLVANELFVVADRIESRKATIQEFPIPRAATAGGRLELAWSCGEGQRSTEVAEVWLIKHAVDPKSTP